MVLFDNFITDALNNKKYALAIFCDLRKAFETVNHDILLNKLQMMGVRENELDWFKNYLSGRKQFVFIDGKCSSLRDIMLGVPQGSILGPLLFLIYINDLPSCTSLFSLLFADDTNLLAQAGSPEELFEYVNIEFNKVYNYFQKNHLSIHPSKTNYMVFSNNKHEDFSKFTITLDGRHPDQASPLIDKQCLKQITTHSDVPAVRFLGLYIDPHLNYKYHMSIIKKKISNALYFMRTARNLIDVKSLTSLYYSLIHSHLVYAIQVWSSGHRESINTIFKMQKKAIRIIHSLPYNAHTESFFKISKILPLPKMIEYFGLQFMQHFSQDFLPTLLRSVWTTNANRNNGNRYYQLRNSDDIYLPTSRLNSFERHPLYYFPKIWTNFTEYDIKIQREKAIFNSMLKKHLLNLLADNYSCDRLLCPTCHLTRQ